MEAKTCWFTAGRLSPGHPNVTVSSPYRPAPLSPSMFSSIRERLYVPIAFHVEVRLFRKIFPLFSSHTTTSVGQPSGSITHTAPSPFAGSNRKDCTGVPTCMPNVDHGPSMPSLDEGQIHTITPFKGSKVVVLTSIGLGAHLSLWAPSPHNTASRIGEIARPPEELVWREVPF
jgi:hypothetical protein